MKVTVRELTIQVGVRRAAPQPDGTIPWVSPTQYGFVEREISFPDDPVIPILSLGTNEPGFYR